MPNVQDRSSYQLLGNSVNLHTRRHWTQLAIISYNFQIIECVHSHSTTSERNAFVQRALIIPLPCTTEEDQHQFTKDID